MIETEEYVFYINQESEIFPNCIMARHYLGWSAEGGSWNYITGNLTGLCGEWIV